MEDTKLCPVYSLTTYYSKVKVPVWRFLWLLTFVFQVSGIRGDNRAFFVSYQWPHKSVTSQTLARWMKVILTEAGVDPGVWKPHAVRSASSSHHTTSKQLDLEQICRLADWSMASSTYLKFYKCYVWVLPPGFYLLFVLLVHVPLLYWKLRLSYLSTSSLH